MFDVLLSIAISFTVTFLAIPVIITVAERKKLYDIPDERKIHEVPIPSLGGLGIFAGFVLACLVAMQFQKSTEMQYFLAAAFVIFFLGLKDDILVISPIKKFIGQVLAAFLIIYKGGVQITSMHGFLGIHELPESFSLLLTYFTVIVIINSFNLIDGIDGLAGSLGLMTSIIFGFYFLQNNLIGYAILAFALAGSVAAFLIFNFQPAKVFMGDTGSLLLGLITSILAIKFIDAANATDVAYPLAASPALAFTILMIPLLDTLRVFAIRIVNRRSPFSPDRNHIHHMLLDRGLSHRNIALGLVAVNLLFVVLAYSLRNVGCTWIILGVIGFFFSGIAALYYTRPQPRLFVARSVEREGKEKGTTKIVPLTKDTILEHKN
ncbi:undecaprenyl/decaprenyl-phosphate alpha-N-acetylglucosaminyl 1-phosphate transferase [Pseudoflavitalea sp. G-6-1-2]|uniref:MraY family glycosyltransferase n=1 Tax=Pseudoflavitalea sp. G-6-1-2 TaxID=2728841 RepID=UPI00146CC3EB|nr:MraY family glycosyltransferase [Pseudoflavitalea sp. G-6-1-2]NML20432.1 undecaprenyl/decaprenyl-phosphate alpha-N-acetylglucosaminyl 1-phosphate transferase [Pseudoflavitalea sp. G-6-1-2]